MSCRGHRADIGPFYAHSSNATDRSKRHVRKWQTDTDPPRLPAPQRPDRGRSGRSAGQDIFYRVQFQDLDDIKNLSEPVAGHLRTAPTEGEANLPPSAGMQFFGEAKIAGDTGVMTVMLKDLAGATLYSVDLQPSV